MKRSQLKAIIKEIVTQVMAEMPQQSQQPQQSQRPEAYVDVQEWDMVEDDVVEFKGVLLPDEREVDISVEFSGDWDDGAFDHAFGTHRYPVSYQTDGVRVTYAMDHNTQQDLPLDTAIVAAGEALFNAYEDSIIEKKNENPPDNEPDPDDQRDRDIDREMGL